MAAKATVLEMQHITKEFPGVKALEDVSFDVRAEEIHGIVGENGAGKSTLMKVLSGVHPHGTYSGEIIYQGQPCRFRDIRSSEHHGIVIIHQELALIPELSITENIFLGNEPSVFGVVNWDKAQATAIDLLARVGLQEDPLTPIKQLGVGKQQLVEIAKALHKSVKLLILDEPTAALNEEDSQHLLDLIRGLKAKGVACVIISHKLNEIEEIADRITIIRDGRTIETLDKSQGEINEDRIIKGMVGRSLDNRFPDREPVIGQEMFRVEGWNVRHPDVPERMVCRDSSFFVRAGEIVGFAGLMGAGRTELMRSLFGKSFGIWEAGHMFLNGKEIHLNSVSEAIDAGLGYVTEDRKVLGLNLLDDIKTTTVAADLKKISRYLMVDEDAEYKAAEHYRQALRTKTPSVHVGVRTLSGGNQQKVVLAKWLFTEPDLLILDEPTRGIDVGAKYEIYQIIHNLAAEGKGVIVVSSELPELLGLSDRIYAISRGRITGVLDRGNADQESLMRLMTAHDHTPSA